MDNMTKSAGKVLVIDDEPDIVEFMIEELQYRGLECLTASNGKEALDIIRAEKPNVIISDYLMPKLNGIELLKFLNDLNIQTPVIWLSGNADPETFREAWRMGVYDFFKKPFKVDEVVNLVLAAIEMKPVEMVSRRPKFLNDGSFQMITIDIEKVLFEKLMNKCLNESSSISRYITQLLVQSLEPPEKAEE